MENININKKIKVLITASTFPRYASDTEPRFILDLAEALQPYCDVTVLAPSAPEAAVSEILNDVRVIRYRYFPIKRFETLCYPGAIVPRVKENKIRALLIPFLFISLWIYLLKHGKEYDVINPHWIIPQGIVQSFSKGRYVITGHGADVTSLNTAFVRVLKARCLRRASGITVVSTRLADFLQENYGIQNIKVCPMGCKLNTFSPSNRIMGYFNQGNKKVVLFVGRLAEKKGVSYLIHAMGAVDAKLVIVGTGPLEQELKKQAEETGADIIFLGAKSHDEIKTILASVDVYVAPSITAKNGDQEGLPVSIMEAMASGVPVVASKSGGIPDLVIDGINGLLVNEKDVNGLAERINKVLTDKNYGETLAANALETIKKYDYKIIAKEYYNLYKCVANEGNSVCLEGEQ